MFSVSNSRGRRSSTWRAFPQANLASGCSAALPGSGGPTVILSLGPGDRKPSSYGLCRVALACFLLYCRLRPVCSESRWAPNSKLYAFNCCKNSPNKQSLSHLEPALHTLQDLTDSCYPVPGLQHALGSADSDFPLAAGRHQTQKTPLPPSPHPPALLPFLMVAPRHSLWMVWGCDTCQDVATCSLWSYLFPGSALNPLNLWPRVRIPRRCLGTEDRTLSVQTAYVGLRLPYSTSHKSPRSLW